MARSPEQSNSPVRGQIAALLSSHYLRKSAGVLHAPRFFLKMNETDFLPQANFNVSFAVPHVTKYRNNYHGSHCDQSARECSSFL
jgi:hypothetical protein